MEKALCGEGPGKGSVTVEKVLRGKRPGKGSGRRGVLLWRRRYVGRGQVRGVLLWRRRYVGEARQGDWGRDVTVEKALRGEGTGKMSGCNKYMRIQREAA